MSDDTIRRMINHLVLLAISVSSHSAVAAKPTRAFPALSGPFTIVCTPYSGSAVSIEASSFKLDTEQTLNIGSQFSGAGAGKVTFNPFVITKKVDDASAILFQMECSGTAFQSVVVSASGFTMTLSLAAVKTQSIAVSPNGDLLETVSFEYGGLKMTNGKTKGGWDRVTNKAMN